MTANNCLPCTARRVTLDRDEFPWSGDAMVAVCPGHHRVPATAVAVCWPLTQGSVLIVDDDAELRVILVRALRRLGLVVVEAGDGVQGLAVLEALSPPRCRLVLCDRDMPIMDGPTMIGQLRARWDPSLLPVVVMSGTDGPVPGADAFVAKPFRLNVLLETVTALLARDAVS